MIILLFRNDGVLLYSILTETDPKPNGTLFTANHIGYTDDF